MKKLKTLLAASSILMAVAGCNSEQKDTETIVINALWDNLSFIIADDIDEGIASDELSISQNLFDDVPRAQSIIDNTKVLREYAQQKNIKLSSSNMGWNDGLTTALLSCFWMQDGPDIIQGEEQLPQFVDAGYIEPFPDDMAARIKEKCSPLAYQGLEKDGKLYGLAIQPGLSLLYWNKDLLIQAGYDANDPIVTNGPQTWDEWLESMDRVNQVNGPENAPHGGGVYVGAQMGGYLRVGALLDSCGASFADENGAPSVNNDKVTSAFKFLSQQREYNLNGVCNSIDYFSTYDKAFSRGEIAYKVDGNWCNYELDQINLNYGCSLIPSATIDGNPGTMQIGACYMCVPTYSKHKDEAFYILEAMLDERIQKNIADIGYRMPVLKSIITSDDYKTKNKVLSDFANYAMTNDIPKLPPFQGNVSEIWNSVGTALGSVYGLNVSDKTISETIARLQENMTTNYNKR